MLTKRMGVKQSRLRPDSTAALSARSGGGREITFWLLLFGSWMMLNSPAWPNQLLGGLGTASFLVLAFASLGRLRAMGMEFADWRPAAGRFWAWAMAAGTAAGFGGISLAHLTHSRIKLAENWRVFLLEGALGPVLEEMLFRGYLMRLLFWMLRVGTRDNKGLAGAVAALASGVAFGAIHLLRPGTTWGEVAVIGVMGSLYGSIRLASGSSAPAALAHAVYNVTLHIGMAVFL